ncbi:no-associated protein 1 [Quercus suber]|uniref:No-associated protein 1 n=1 Tax=Quercus suber TaxID=58331 RepID=A0AAW0K1H9_QUESU
MTEKKAETKKKKKMMKKEKVLKVSMVVATCYGCGAPLQTSDSDAQGYVDIETNELKKKHHQLRTILCGRCRLLSHGHMITAVGGNGGYSGGKQFVTAEQLSEKLSHLRYEKALIVDIVDFNGSFLARVRDLAGANPIILVVDLLPKGTDFNCVGDWVVEATTKKKLNVLSVHLTSSKSLVGIVGVASEIQKEKKDPVAAAAQKYKPIQSAVPGTTLSPIQINASLGGGNSQVASDNGTASEIQSNDLNGFGLHFHVLPETCLTFYGPKALRIHMKELGVLLTPPTGKKRADDWRGLETERQLRIPPACDVAISGLGWISIEPVSRSIRQSDSDSDLNLKDKAGELHLTVHVPKPVEAFVRPPLPVGKVGAEWYQYRELTDKEEEI